MLSNYLTTFTLITVSGLIAAPALADVEKRYCIREEPTEQTATWNFEREAATKLDRITVEIAEIRERIANLRSFSHGTHGPTYSSHLRELAVVRDRVNSISEKLCRLGVIRLAVSDWQRETYYRIQPEFERLARLTAEAIDYADQNRDTLWKLEYREQLKQISQQARMLERAADLGVESRAATD